MINGFEEHTKPLTANEMRNIVPILVSRLSKNIGSRMIVSNKRICKCLEQVGIKVSGARLRKMLNYIRTNDLIPCLVATERGYYVAETEQELIDYEQSLQRRMESISELRVAIERQRIKTYSKA